MIELTGHVKVVRLTGRLMVDSAGRAEPRLQEKTVIPTAAEQAIEKDPGFDGLGVVTVVGDPDFIAKNIRNGVKIWGIMGTGVTSPFAVKAVGVIPIIHKGTARSRGLDSDNFIFESSASGVLANEG